MKFLNIIDRNLPRIIFTLPDPYEIWLRCSGTRDLNSNIENDIPSAIARWVRLSVEDACAFWVQAKFAFSNFKFKDNCDQLLKVISTFHSRHILLRSLPSFQGLSAGSCLWTLRRTGWLLG